MLGCPSLDDEPSKGCRHDALVRTSEVIVHGRIVASRPLIDGHRLVHTGPRRSLYVQHDRWHAGIREAVGGREGNQRDEHARLDRPDQRARWVQVRTAQRNDSVVEVFGPEELAPDLRQRKYASVGLGGQG